jgi:imidazole glycerol-phosphate synthase subunit HisH
MISKRVTILDYGMCNLLNVARAVAYVGLDADVTDDVSAARTAERLIVPGVGAFARSMAQITAAGFDDAIRDFVATGRPFLGICVGMQVLFDASDEFGTHDGLGLLSGRVVQIPKLTKTDQKQRVPHIGWNHLVPSVQQRPWEGSILQPLAGSTPAVYFVHSFACQPADPAVHLADTMYGGHRLCAAVMAKNIMGTQFHPERSSSTGLQVLRQFGAM